MRCKMIGAVLLACAIPLSATAQSVEEMMSAANEQLKAMGKEFRVAYVEYITTGESGEVGRILFASDHGNKQLAFDWVPGDPRREWNSFLWGLTGTDLTVGVDDVDVTTNFPAITMAPGADLQAYHNVNATWDAVGCSTINLLDLGNSNGFDLGVVQNFFGFGGFPGPALDLTHAGMLPATFFDLLTPGGGGFILGVTFTFVFLDAEGNVTDLDRNRKGDVAFREIYYNANFPWQDNPNDVPFDGTIDLESVALHEMGHGLSQAHFGNVGFVDRNRNGVPDPGEISASPEASMNASHTVAHRTVEGTDLGGHCSNWANWPTK